MNHWPVLPIVLPAISAALLVLLPLPLGMQRLLNLAATLVLVGVGMVLVAMAGEGAYATYALGNWPAPYGIVLVVDRLSAAMLLLTAVVALCSLLYAMRGNDADGRYFHALFQFQLMGLNGAFLTGDLFNMFVFFEVLLIASYCLLVHGTRTQQLRPGFHYVAINFGGSFLFLIAVSLLYAMTGTLNMADMAIQVASAEPADAALIRAGALLLLVVFATKAALLPLYFWLPRAYSAADAPVAALFAIMTKVGAYAILRVYTLIFGPDAGVASDVATPWLLPAALATLVAATVGVLASRTLRTMTGYLTISSVGIICIGAGLYSEASIGAAIYYLVHSTLTIALLFLLADLIRRGRGEAGDSITRARQMAQPALLGWLFIGGGVAAVGIPPLSGFFAKLMLLDAAREHAAVVWVWAIVLATALFSLVAMARAGTIVFWHTDTSRQAALLARRPVDSGPAEFIPVLVLLACIVGVTIWAGPVADYTTAAAEQLLQPAGYIRSVLEEAPMAGAAVTEGLK